MLKKRTLQKNAKGFLLMALISCFTVTGAFSPMAEEETETETETVSDPAADAMITADTVLEQTVVTYGTKTDAIEGHTYQIAKGATGVNIPVQISGKSNTASYSWFDFQCSGNSGSIVYQINQSPTYSLTDLGTVDHFLTKKDFRAYFPKGTYYLHFLKDADDLDQDVRITVRLYTCKTTAKGGTVKAGKWMSGFQETKKLSYKLKLTAVSAVTVKYAGIDNADLVVLNSKKKAISNQAELSQSNPDAAFVLEKGTYYLQIKPQGEFRIKISTKKIKVKSNLSSKKAAQIKKGKSITDVVSTAQKTSYTKYYKIVVPKTGTVKLIFSNKASGYMEVALGKKVGGDIIASCTVTPGEKKTLEKFDMNTLESKPLKLKKGTYYFRVRKMNKKDSLYYTIQYTR